MVYFCPKIYVLKEIKWVKYVQVSYLTNLK